MAARVERKGPLRLPLGDRAQRPRVCGVGGRDARRAVPPHHHTAPADAAPRDLASRTRAAALRATVKIRSRSRSALKSCVFLQPSGLAASATSPRCDASMVLEWLEKSIPGTSGALCGFGAAGVVLVRAAGPGAGHVLPLVEGLLLALVPFLVLILVLARTCKTHN